MIQWMAARAAARIWWPAVVGAGVIAGPAFMLGQCSGVEIQKGRATAAQISGVARDGQAKEVAATERGQDTARIQSEQEDQTDAIHSGPDEAPSSARRRRACVQLRQQGTPADRLPADCGSDGGGQADAQR